MGPVVVGKGAVELAAERLRRILDENVCEQGTGAGLDFGAGQGAQIVICKSRTIISATAGA